MQKHFYACLSLIIFVLFLFDGFWAHAATIELRDCSQSVVNNAINSASDGDIIVCPAGRWTWSDVNITNKNITLQGAGIDKTEIVITAARGIEATSSNTKPFRITGFTFSSSSNFGTETGMMGILGGTQWRIDHNIFRIFSNNTGTGGNAIYIKDAKRGDNIGVYGLVDHNEFTDHPSSTGCWHVGVYMRGDGEIEWSMDSQIGGGKGDRTIFIEDNKFVQGRNDCQSHNGHAAYAGQGTMYVLRHNTIIGQINADAHGFCYTIGTREYAIYNNTWIAPSGVSIYTLVGLRGGTGVVYNNEFISQGGGAKYGVELQDVRINSSPNCSNTLYHMDVEASSNCATNEGYPCVDQIGRGKNQTKDPLYVWNNKNFPSMNIISSSYFQQGRDYYLNSGPKPGYIESPYPHPLTGKGAYPGASTPNPPSALQVY